MQTGQFREISEHAWKDGHIIEWDQVEVLDTVTDERVKEAPPGVRMNGYEGRDVSPLWLNAIKKLAFNEEDRRKIAPGRQRQQWVLDARSSPTPQLLHPPDTGDRRLTSGRGRRHTQGRA